MTEYIEREAFKAEVRRLSTHYLNEWDTLGVLAAADRIPAADVRPVVRATNKSESGFLCSVCSFGDFGGFHGYKPNFCPNCGADMRGAPNGV